jgi:curved DNA-binding protein CbpA
VWGVEKSPGALFFLLMCFIIIIIIIIIIMILLLLLLFLFSFSSCSLGVFGRRCSSKCDAAALKAGYQAAAKASHPDRPGGSKATFQRVAAAYATLKHAKARAAYDAAQRAWRAAADAADAAAAAAADAARRAKKRGGVAEDRRSIRAKASGGGGGLGGGGGGGDFDGDSGGGGSGVGQSSRKRGAAAAQSLFEVDPLEWYRRASGGDAMVAAVANGDATGLQAGGSN